MSRKTSLSSCWGTWAASTDSTKTPKPSPPSSRRSNHSWKDTSSSSSTSDICRKNQHHPPARMQARRSQPSYHRESTRTRRPMDLQASPKSVTKAEVATKTNSNSNEPKHSSEISSTWCAGSNKLIKFYRLPMKWTEIKTKWMHPKMILEINS